MRTQETTDIPPCRRCQQAIIPAARWVKGGMDTCMSCGAVEAAAQVGKYAIVPMHKSNYTVITRRNELRGVNTKCTG